MELMKKPIAERKKRVNRPSRTMKFRQSLFWDVNPKTIDPNKHAFYIIERIMDFGTDDEVRWMWYYYPHSLLRKVLKKSRVIHAPTRSLWSLLLAKT